MAVLDSLRLRARIYRQIRGFFSSLGHLEVDTPILAASTNTDVHIQSIAASVNGHPGYLQTSPEFYMKRLLVEGSGSIYQICHAFRDGEVGKRHRAEFTLLEWYSLGLDYSLLMTQLEALVIELMDKPIAFQRLSYFDCFDKMLSLDLASATIDDCRSCVRQHIPSVEVQQLQRDDCLDLLISQVVSRQFSGFTFVYDFPASQASLARIKPDNPLVAERFELFFRDIELANGFTELTDAGQQRERFQQDNLLRLQQGLTPYPIDEDFLRALQAGMPECAGVALGVDRLMMVMLGQDSIECSLALP